MLRSQILLVYQEGAGEWPRFHQLVSLGQIPSPGSVCKGNTTLHCGWVTAGRRNLHGEIVWARYDISSWRFKSSTIYWVPSSGQAMFGHWGYSGVNPEEVDPCSPGERLFQPPALRSGSLPPGRVRQCMEFRCLCSELRTLTPRMKAHHSGPLHE